MSKWNVIGPTNTTSVQLELFDDLPRLHVISNEAAYDVLRGGHNAIDDIHAECETVVLVGYLKRGGVSVYSVGQQPTIERTIWMLDRAKHFIHNLTQDE